MRALRAWLTRLAGLLARAKQERDLTEELESHLDMAIDDYVRAGMSRPEARRQALIALGGVEATKERCRDAQRLALIESVLRDVRDAFRSVRRSPLFSLVVVLSLGIAFGANTAILDVAHELFLRALPIHDPDRVVAIYSSHPDLGDGPPLSFLNWRDVQRESTTLTKVAGYEWASLPVELERGATRFSAQIVSGNYFQTLGVNAAFGRTFSDSALPIPGADLEVVVSHRFWQVYLGGDPSAVGQTLRIRGHPFTIVGVTGPEFHGVNVGLHAELWIPFGVYRQIYSERDWVWYENRRGLLVYGIGRLAPETDLAEVQAELSTLAKRLEEAHPEFNENRGIRALPIARATIFPWARPFVHSGMLLLTGAVSLTLLIAAVSVANLFVVRALERRKDIAIRLALGVSRRALATRLWIESVVLSCLGGCAGIGFLWITQIALARVVAAIPSPTSGPYALTLDLDPALVAIAFGIAAVVGLTLGLVPVVAALRESSDTLSVRSDTPAGEARRFGLRNGLLVAQLALSFVAVFGGSLFFRSLAHIRTLDPGFETRRLAFLRVDLSSPRASEGHAARARERIVEAVAALPGVESVGVSPRRPMDGGWSRPMAPLESAADASRHISPFTDRVDGGFFDAMGLALFEGRTFDREDQLGSPRVAIVNAVLAEQLWPDQSAIGRTLVLFDLAGETPLEIVGVVETSRYRRVTETPRGYVYMPLSSDHAGFLTLAVRTASDPGPSLTAALAEIRRLEPSIPVSDPQTVSEVLDQSMWGPWLAASFLGLFAYVALLLSAVGIYGVISYDVGRRTREFCVRVAVGAKRVDIVGLVLRQCGKHYALGLALGLPLAFALSKWISNLVFVDWLDPYAGLGTFVPLIVVGVVAALIPARRATAVDPNEVLRSE